MSGASTPNHSHGSAFTEVAKERSLSINAIQRSRRSSRRDSVLPLCMSRDQHAAVRAAPSPSPSRQQQQLRRRRLSSVSSTKARHATLVPVGASTQPSMAGNGWTALLAHPDANPEVARAVQMCSLYPTLRVAGTAFENSLNLAHRHSAESFTLLSSSRRGTEVLNNGSFSGYNRDDVPCSPRTPRMSTSVLLETSSVLREATEDWRAFHDGGGGGAGNGRNSVVSTNAAEAATRNMVMAGGTKMVQMACAMKRAAMWEVVVATALAHRVMELKFRRDRLRRVLERHLLPAVLKRKNATGSVVAKGARSEAVQRRARRDANDDSSTAGSGGGVDSGSAPQGSYLREHSAFFASLNNSSLLQSFAETMTRHRFLPGEVIARAGQQSQCALYFLISGKCEVTKERGDVVDGVGGGNVDHFEDGVLHPAVSDFNAGRGNAATPSYRDGMHSSKAPRLRPGARDSSVSRCQKEVLLPGTTFGGIFGGSALFSGTYRALSQCIVWELRCEDFEQVFRPFSDRVMLDKYKESMRAHGLAWLQQRYPASKVFGSIPVYRRLASRKARYLSDFTPVALVRGELLFAQDHDAGDVYCLLEGTVLRRMRGAAGGGEGVAQRLSTNAFSSVRAAGRFLLLGEEPHILPGLQPYSCTVSSRVAFFYKIPGERFVSALLDDPTLYAQLRERLMKQRQASMALHPECLAYVPLLRRFPAEKRAELVQYAQPRVIGRSTSLCEPAQHLSELMLVVAGDVCDPRRFGQRPTASLRVPASIESETSGGNGGGGDGGGGSGDHHGGGASGRGKSGRTAEKRRHEPGTATPGTAAGAGGGGGGAHGGASWQGSVGAKGRIGSTAHVDDDDSGEDDDGGGVSGHHGAASEVVGEDWNFSISEVPLLSTTGNNVSVEMSSFYITQRSHNGGGGGGSSSPSQQPLTPAQQHQKLCQSAPLVYPDESEELNPPPPAQASRSFLYALGGSWEALLLDKWPSGWEATATVALWAIPTYRLRLVYNSCSKATQTYILSGLRVAQREDLHLTSTPHTKLPPMTVYTQRPDATTGASAAAAAVAGAGGASAETRSLASTRSSFYRRPPRKAQQQQQLGESGKVPNMANNTSKVFGGATEQTASFYRSGDAPSGMHDSTTGRSPDDVLGAKGGRGQRATVAAIKGGAAASPSGQAKAGGPSKAHTTSPPPRHAATVPSVTSTKAKSAGAGGGVDGAASTGERGGAAAGTAEEGQHSRSPESRPGAVGRRPRKAPSPAAASLPPAPIPIDPVVKAAYDGVFGATDPLMLRIVRDPVVQPAPRRTSKGANAALAGRTLPPLPGTPPGPTAASSAAWPAQAPAQERWFQAVPSYEPLPGTMRAADTLAAPPVFAPNSTVLASAGVGAGGAHGKTLEGHVAYYAATLSPSAAGTLRDGSGAVSVAPHPLPKRHAYAS